MEPQECSGPAEAVAVLTKFAPDAVVAAQAVLVWVQNATEDAPEHLHRPLMAAAKAQQASFVKLPP